MPIMGYKQDPEGKTLGLYYNDLYDITMNKYACAETDVLTREQCVTPEGEESRYCIPKEAIFAIAL
jgi:hypothetical protein